MARAPCNRANGRIEPSAPTGPANTAAQVPSRCHIRNNPYAVSHGPYRSGMSRHGDPVRTRHRIALMT
jgi:hypothetical protein